MNTTPTTLAFAANLFEKARPSENLERVNLARHIQTVLGHSLITVSQFSANVQDKDGRRFGSHRVGTLFGVIDPQGVAYEGSDNTPGVNSGRWGADFTSYEFTQILKRGEHLVLVGSKTEFRQIYDEARCLQGGWVSTPVGTEPIEVELKRVESPPEPA